MKMRLTPPVAAQGAWLIAGRSAAGAVLLVLTVSACTGGGTRFPNRSSVRRMLFSVMSGFCSLPERANSRRMIARSLHCGNANAAAAVPSNLPGSMTPSVMSLRAALTLFPALMNRPDSQPPATLPMSEIR